MESKAEAPSKKESSHMFGNMFGFNKPSVTESKSEHNIIKSVAKSTIFAQQNLNETKKLVKNTNFLVKLYSHAFRSQDTSVKFTKDLLTQQRGFEKRSISREKSAEKRREKLALETEFTPQDNPIVKEQKLTNDFLKDILKSNKKSDEEQKSKGFLSRMFGNVGKMVSDFFGSIPFGKVLMYGMIGVVSWPLVKKIVGSIIHSETLQNLTKLVWDKLFPDWLKDTIGFVKHIVTDPMSVIKDIGNWMGSSIEWLWGQFKVNWVDPTVAMFNDFVESGKEFFRDPLGIHKKKEPITKGKELLYDPLAAEKYTKKPWWSGKEYVGTYNKFNKLPIDSLKPSDIAKITERVNKYQEYITKASSTYGVDANIIKAIIAQESRGYTGLKSKAGAVGLMQLLPKYFNGAEKFSNEKNIMEGTKYFKSLLRQYGGNTDLAFAAYNAGAGAVNKYGTIPPFKETQEYVPSAQKYVKIFNKEDENKLMESLNRSIEINKKTIDQLNKSTISDVLNTRFNELIDAVNQSTAATKENKISMRSPVISNNPMR